MAWVIAAEGGWQEMDSTGFVVFLVELALAVALVVAAVVGVVVVVRRGWPTLRRPGSMAAGRRPRSSRERPVDDGEEA